MQAQPQGVLPRTVPPDPKIESGNRTPLKWRPVRVESFMAPSPDGAPCCIPGTPPLNHQDEVPEMELNLDKDSDFQQHAQYQPDHATSFPFHCYCGHEFLQQKSYRMHILDGMCINWQDIKIRGNLIICTCGVEFAQRGSLFRHLRARQCKAYWPHGGRALHCLCGAKFNRRDNMIRHQRSPRCRQNCARLGVTGNPSDAVPPLRKSKFVKPGEDEQKSAEREAEYFENALNEAEVNYRWYKHYGGHKRQRMAPQTLQGDAPTRTESQSPELVHKTKPSSGTAPGPPLAIDSQADPQEHSPQGEDIASPQGSQSQATISRKTSMEPSDDAQPGSRREFTRPSTFYGFQQTPNKPQLYYAHDPKMQECAMEASQGLEDGDTADKQQEYTLYHGSKETPIVHSYGEQKPSLEASTALKDPNGPQGLQGPQPSTAPPPVPPVVEAEHIKTKVETPDPPLFIAIEKLSGRIDGILTKYEISDPSFAPTVADTLRAIVAGFLKESVIPRDRAALLCETVSTGISQILLVKLMETTNNVFVQIAHRVDKAVYEELCDPLKALIAPE